MCTKSNPELEKMAIGDPRGRTEDEWLDVFELLLARLSAADVLLVRPRQRRRIPGTNWFYRPHGAGVDIGRGLVCDGIDFDFDEPHPGPWRLRTFAEKQLNAGNLPTEDYRDLVDDEDRFIAAATVVLSQLAPASTGVAHAARKTE